MFRSSVYDQGDPSQCGFTQPACRRHHLIRPLSCLHHQLEIKELEQPVLKNAGERLIPLLTGSTPTLDSKHRHTWLILTIFKLKVNEQLSRIMTDTEQKSFYAGLRLIPGSSEPVAHSVCVTLPLRLGGLSFPLD